MALTVTRLMAQRAKLPQESRVLVVAQVIFDNSYPTGGWPVTPDDLRLAVRIDWFFVRDIDSSYHLMVDHANKKIKVGLPAQLTSFVTSGSGSVIISTNLLVNEFEDFTLTVSGLTGIRDNDQLVMHVAMFGVFNRGVIQAEPAGLTVIRSVGDTRHYRKTALGESGSYTWTIRVNGPVSTTDGIAIACIAVYRGVKVAAPINVENGQTTASGTSHATPDVTTSVENARIVTMFAVSALATMTPPTGETERVEAGHATRPGVLSINDEVQVGSGATGAKTATSSVAGAGTAQIVALAPESGAELANGSAALDGKKALLFGWGS